MPAVTLSADMIVTVGGIRCRVVGIPQKGHVSLLQDHDQDTMTLDLEDLTKKISMGTAEITPVVTGNVGRDVKINGKLKGQLATMKPDERNVVLRRRDYIKAIEAYMPIPKTRDRLEPIIAETAKRIGDPKAPHWTTVARWYRDFLDGRRDLRALRPSYEKRGNRSARLSPDQEQIINQVIETRYLNARRAAPAEVMDAVNLGIAKHNSHLPKSRHMDFVAKRTIYRKLNKLDPYTVVRCREGKDIADRRFRAYGKSPVATRPLERVEIDHTVLDLILVDEETGLPLGRPTLTVAIDCYSRMIVGFYLGFEPPGWQTVMHCLRMMIMPKGEVIDGFPSINGVWPCFGACEVLVVDNGREFHSTDLEMACEQLGIEVVYAPRTKAWYKGKVERIFGTINTRLLRGVKGKTLPIAREIVGYDPQKDAIVNLGQFTEGFCKWIVDVYARTYHNGLCGVPLDVWNDGRERFPAVRLPASIDDLIAILSHVQERTIGKDGIVFKGLRYVSEDLNRILVVYKRTKNPKVQVKIDPSDLGSVFVAHPDGSGFFRVPARDPEYARGLNLWQHQVICKWRARRKHENDFDLSLMEAREEIRSIFNEVRARKQKIARTKKIARFNGQGSNRYIAAPKTAPSSQKPDPGSSGSSEFDQAAMMPSEDRPDTLDSEDWGYEE
ncbi:MAG: hypothetical protein EP335_05815 [Alphaproteobacteria bacterium]|nr:MAG: hypothetical protein EP335_05815 [Alphaproteobacteria bacterium]